MFYQSSELAREKKFLPGAIFKDEQEKRAGTLSLEMFKEHSEQEKKLVELRSYGLTDYEIKKTTIPEESNNLSLQLKNVSKALLNASSVYCSPVSFISKQSKKFSFLG